MCSLPIQQGHASSKTAPAKEFLTGGVSQHRLILLWLLLSMLWHFAGRAPSPQNPASSMVGMSYVEHDIWSYRGIRERSSCHAG